MEENKKNHAAPPAGRPGMGPGGPGPRGMRGPGGKPKDAKATVGRIFRYIKIYHSAYAKRQTKISNGSWNTRLFNRGSNCWNRYV